MLADDVLKSLLPGAGISMSSTASVVTVGLDPARAISSATQTALNNKRNNFVIGDGLAEGIHIPIGNWQIKLDPNRAVVLLRQR